MTNQTGDVSEKCLVCERNAEQVPLVALRHKGQNYWICPEHLPILIHKPHTLTDKLPGASALGPGGD